ncbi:Mchr2 [Columba livia]|nr:Mchr2 [Columba livia]
MSEFRLSCKNSTPGSFNSSWSGWHHYQVIGAAETIILPSLIGVICSTGLVGNILIVFTIIRIRQIKVRNSFNCIYDIPPRPNSDYILKTIPDIYICNLAIADLVHIIGMPFLIHQWARGGEWAFGSPLCTIITSLDASNQFTCSAIMTAMSLDRYIALVQPFRLTHLRTRSKTIRVNLCLWVASLILMFPVWVYSKVIKFKDGLESCAFDLTSPDNVLCYTTSIPRKRVMRLTKMVLALVSVFVVSAAPFHVIQLMNLQVSQPTLTFYLSYYVSICFSYTSSSINPFLYILLSGNFQKRLRRCTNVDVRMAERDVNIIENTLKSSF